MNLSSLHIDTARSWRGGQNQVLLTVLGLRAAGHRAGLVARPDGELRRRAAEGLDLFPVAVRTEVDLTAAWRLSRIVRDVGPGVLHAHDPHAVAMAALALSLGAFDRRPVLAASRRVDFPLKRNAFSRWKYRQVEVFICASELIRQMLLAGGIPAERTVTVHEGIDIEHVDAAPPLALHADLWLPTHAPVVGNVAALVPHKGHRYLIDAARLVLRDVPDARFVIAGEGELREALTRQVHEHGLDRHVVLAGFRPDVLSMHHSFDLFVMSSVTEGLGTSLLDAMACGKAIVATRTGGIPEVVEDGETGLLVPPRDSGAIAAAIVRLLKDPALRQRLGAAGRAVVERRFSMARMVSDTVEVYRRFARPAARARETVATPRS